MRSILSATILLLCISVLLAAGCSTPSQTAALPKSAGDVLLQQGEHEFQNGNYHAAEALFVLAQQNFTAAGDAAGAIAARNRSTTMIALTFGFPYNHSEAEQQVAETFPYLSASERAALLEESNVTTLKADGEVMYSADIVNNIWFHHTALMQNRTKNMHYSPFYDQIMPLATAPAATGTGPYGAPVAYDGVAELTIPRSELPANGTFRVWMPLPIETGSQTNVTIVSIEPAQYVKSMTGTGSEIGIAYLEVPLAEYHDPFLNVTARYRFIQHEQRFAIDPAKVQPYNMSDPLYLKYTKPGQNIVITPDIARKAREIAGNETNPYLQAQKIYWYIVDTYPYSHAPHAYLDATKTPEAEYMHRTGIGDCGTQSMYFAALCRSLGIPARAPGGYQMVEGTTGTHFWAEYYLEGYGWVPADVTIAEGADWAYNADNESRHRYKAYYSQNLDPYRYIIQNDVDIPLVPAVANPVISDMSFQTPKTECDTCTTDPNIEFAGNSRTTVTKE